MNRESYKLNIAEPELISDEQLLAASGGSCSTIRLYCPICYQAIDGRSLTTSRINLARHIKNKH